MVIRMSVLSFSSRRRVRTMAVKSGALVEFLDELVRGVWVAIRV